MRLHHFLWWILSLCIQKTHPDFDWYHHSLHALHTCRVPLLCCHIWMHQFLCSQSDDLSRIAKIWRGLPVVFNREWVSRKVTIHFFPVWKIFVSKASVLFSNIILNNVNQSQKVCWTVFQIYRLLIIGLTASWLQIQRPQILKSEFLGHGSPNFTLTYANSPEFSKFYKKSVTNRNRWYLQFTKQSPAANSNSFIILCLSI